MSNSSFGRISGLLQHKVDFSVFLDEVPIGIAIISESGKVTFANRAYESLTGVKRSEVCGLPCMHILRCDYCMKGCPVENLTQVFQPVSRAADILNRERQKVPVRLTVSPLEDADGNPAGYVETVQDMRIVTELSEQASRAYSLGGIIGKSKEIEKVFNMIPSVAQTDSSVLITGETGTGKDMLAEAIHNASDRAGGPFIKVNCGALPDNLLESELFGHTKGAFTGADKSKPGRIKLAHGGTLFLTEIGDLPLALQVKLLSFLDDKIIYPLGSTAGIETDVRIIVATHRNLVEMVKEKRFRQDLLFRLNVVRFHLPPLRDRGDDVFLLKGHFLRQHCAKFKKNIDGFSEPARQLLNTYLYPGNVRELKNIVEYAVNFCPDSTIDIKHLPAYLTEPHPQDSAPVDIPTGQPAMQSAAGPAFRHAPASSWDETERQLILDTLIRTGGRKSEAAKQLGWARSTLWRKMKQHNISQ
ncbi:MAG: sigma-54 interaction domain-containing protein [Desulfovibrio sp.]